MATASSTLANMTVPVDGGATNLLMPKLQFRFRVNFINFGTSAGKGVELTKQVIDCSRPNVQFQEITMPIYNSTMYLSGKHQWQPMTINIRDDAQGNVAKAVGAQLQKQLDMAEQASAAAGVDYKFETTVEILDGGNGISAPVVLETWDLVGCFVQTANYNTLNYGTNDVVTISLTIRFDNAVQYAGAAGGSINGGVGGVIGRTIGAATAQNTGAATGAGS